MGGGVSKPTLPPAIAKICDEIFEIADRDKSGAITKDEVKDHPGVSAVLFAKDANGDGKVTKAEFVGAFAKILKGKSTDDMTYMMVDAQLSGMLENLKAK